MKTKFNETKNQPIEQGSVIVTDCDKYLVTREDNGAYRLIMLDTMKLNEKNFYATSDIIGHIREVWEEEVYRIINADNLTIVENQQETPVF